MRLKLRCTGGFAGPAGAQTRTIDLAQLPPGQAEQMQQLVDACDFFALPDKLVKEAPKSWDFQYDLEVDQGGQAHTVRYHLDAVPEQLRALTEKINDEVDPD
nr:protealysin inhibitor emfourin [uncultured Duganella sp.]